ncbi:MAG: hypothetical protein WCI04_03170 [archaeon]
MHDRQLSIRFSLRDKKKSPVKLFSAVLDVKNDLMLRGELPYGVYDPEQNKYSLSNSWQKNAPATPLHEIIHYFAEKAIIKVDVPFATAVDTLYVLENQHESINPELSFPTKKEFDFHQVVKHPTGKFFHETSISYEVGSKIAQWLYLKVPKEKRWDYLYWRCMGKNHERTKRICGIR